ncbi:MAG: helix-turn-helix transcriptional regulator [Firmicutes bacterium]|nr:helix-turn-helix transcriptional regulator [Bacillota bacterium]
MDYKTADRLIELRKKNNYSQDELSEKLSISRQAISKWERAESLPDTENLIALARLYNISLDSLVHGDDTLSTTQDYHQNVKTNEIQEKQRTTGNNRITCLILSIIGGVIALTCLILIGYFIAEIIETVGGYYDHMGQAYVRSEIIGYSIALGFSILGFIAGLIVGIISFKKFRKTNKSN